MPHAPFYGHNNLFAAVAGRSRQTDQGVVDMSIAGYAKAKAKDKAKDKAFIPVTNNVRQFERVEELVFISPQTGPTACISCR